MHLRNQFYSLTLTKFLDFYRGKKEISDIDRVLCHKGAMVWYTIEHDALGVIQQSVHIRVLRGIQQHFLHKQSWRENSNVVQNKQNYSRGVCGI